VPADIDTADNGVCEHHLLQQSAEQPCINALLDMLLTRPSDPDQLAFISTATWVAVAAALLSPAWHQGSGHG
jgi:hypothetical protein